MPLKLPILVAGDFNQILSLEDKFSFCSKRIGGAEWLREFITKFGFCDVQTFGVHFTWTNNRGGNDCTYERLDRAMANLGWRGLFPRAAALCLPIQRSDHSPIIIDTHWCVKARNRPKRFEEIWLRRDEVKQIVGRVWNMSFNGSLSFQLVQKQNVLMKHLRNWGDLSFKFMKRKMNGIRDRLEEIQRDIARGNWNVGRLIVSNFFKGVMGLGVRELMWEDRRLRSDLDRLMEEEEIFWAATCKTKVARPGQQKFQVLS